MKNAFRWMHEQEGQESQRKRVTLRVLAICLLMVLMALPGTGPIRAQAASQPVTISSCTLTSTTKLQVTASCSKISQISGDRCYLFSLPYMASKISGTDKPLVSVKKAKRMTFTVKKKKSTLRTMLDRRFVVAQKSGSSYKIISNYRYITNPGRLASYRYKFPTATSKKGLQVAADMIEDAQELNVRHSTINILFNLTMAGPGEQNASVSIPFKYKGKTYWYSKAAIYSYDAMLKGLKANNAVVSAILLLGYRSDLKDLIAPSGREGGHNYYAWNTQSKAAREKIEACITFLAQRYSASNGANGRIVNWIVGNEVNNYKVWNYGGRLPFNTYINLYESAFRLTYNCVSSVYSNARVYISLDHLWNVNTVDGTYPAKDVLTAFAKAISSHGYIPWNLAYHPYGSPLTEPAFWKNENQWTRNDLNTPVINMNNISLLCRFVKERYGQATRIILSEQGYTSKQNGKNVSKTQAAAIVYSYYLTEKEDMIDSFIMNRHVDHTVEEAQGLALGLWTNSRTEWADTKKPSWDVFKYMDTSKSPSVASSYLKEIGAASWAQLVGTYNAKLYAKTSLSDGVIEPVSGYKKTASITSNWQPYGAVTSVNKVSGGYRIVHNGSLNPNRLWGIAQTFKKKQAFEKNPYFCLTADIRGAAAKSAVVKIRFYAGDKIFDAQRAIVGGKAQKLRVNLSKWPYRKSITHIRIGIAPVKGGWSGSAYANITGICRSR